MSDKSHKKALDFEWPKTVTEMHVHLGGSVALYRLWELAIERGIRGIGDGYEDFINILKIEEGKVIDLDSYLEAYDKVELIQSGPDSVRESIIIALSGAYRTGGMIHLGPGGDPTPHSLFKIGRVELRFNPLKRTGAVFLKGAHAGLYDVDRVILSAIDVAEEVEIGFKGGFRTGFIFCFGRDMTFEANMILARKARIWSEKSDKIIGVDLAGHESINPLTSGRKLDEMRLVFEAVGDKLPRTIHVGETNHVDINTFIKTVEILNPIRVSHPISAIKAFLYEKDDRGLKLIKERDLICELCVKSNLLTGAIKDLQEYGKVLNALDSFDIKYTFSTDAPALQVTTLAGELCMLLNSGVAGKDQILKALDNSEKYSFLPPKMAR